MADKFAKGELVQLKSGGPSMTVDSCPSAPDYMGKKQGFYMCVWFKGATRDAAHFEEHLLQAYEAPKK